MSAREPLGRITKEKLEELAAAELLHALKRRNSLNAEMKISQITAAGDCRLPILRKRQSSCSPLSKLGLSSPFDAFLHLAAERARMVAVKRLYQGVDNARAPRIGVHHLRPSHHLQCGPMTSSDREHNRP